MNYTERISESELIELTKADLYLLYKIVFDHPTPARLKTKHHFIQALIDDTTRDHLLEFQRRQTKELEENRQIHNFEIGDIVCGQGSHIYQTRFLRVISFTKAGSIRLEELDKYSEIICTDPGYHQYGVRVTPNLNKVMWKFTIRRSKIGLYDWGGLRLTGKYDSTKDYYDDVYN